MSALERAREELAVGEHQGAIANALVAIAEALEWGLGLGRADQSTVCIYATAEAACAATQGSPEIGFREMPVIR